MTKVESKKAPPGFEPGMADLQSAVPLPQATAGACTSVKGQKRPDRALTKTFAPDSDLARLINAWPILAAPIKAAILALVGSASTEDLNSCFDRAFDRLDREAGSHN